MKLWDKGTTLDTRVERFTVGNDYILDRALVKHDCRASAAHARMLNAIGVLDAEELLALETALDEIVALDAAGEFEIRPEDEDCHTAIEGYLTEKLGATGRKIHTGRSRNDQVLTTLRLYEKERLDVIRRALCDYDAALGDIVGAEGHVRLPGYTHMQRAMPTTVGAWLGSYRAAARDDLLILDAVAAIIDQNPLGTAAGFGVPVLTLDRDMTTRDLGFARTLENPIYAQLSRGKMEAMLLSACTQILLSINRLASDLMLFTTREFNFVLLSPSVCTGSSMMPQKQNPDVLELLRARYHAVLGEEIKLKSMSANLIAGYHRDLQLTKEPVMRALEATEDCLGILPVVLGGLVFNEARCAAALTPEVYATERALAKVKAGMPFREAYREAAEELSKD